MEEKMKKDLPNKAFVPAENGLDTPATNKQATRPPVKIRFKPGRAGAGVVIAEDNTAMASAEQAEYWVKIGYAEIISEGE